MGSNSISPIFVYGVTLVLAIGFSAIIAVVLSLGLSRKKRREQKNRGSSAGASHGSSGPLNLASKKASIEAIQLYIASLQSSSVTPEKLDHLQNLLLQYRSHYNLMDPALDNLLLTLKNVPATDLDLIPVYGELYTWTLSQD